MSTEAVEREEKTETTETPCRSLVEVVADWLRDEHRRRQARDTGRRS